MAKTVKSNVQPKYDPKSEWAIDFTKKKWEQLPDLAKRYNKKFSKLKIDVRNVTWLDVAEWEAGINKGGIINKVFPSWYIEVANDTGFFESILQTWLGVKPKERSPFLEAEVYLLEKALLKHINHNDWCDIVELVFLGSYNGKPFVNKLLPLLGKAIHGKLTAEERSELYPHDTRTITKRYTETIFPIAKRYLVLYQKALATKKGV